MLNPEFDLLLTALLDGELDPEPRLRVESAVRCDPAAADRLAVLTRVRDLVATLPPPDPTPDVSGEVLAVLTSRRRASFRTIRFAGAIVSSLAAAALLMAIFGPSHRPLARREIAQEIRPIKSVRSRPAPPLMASRTRPTRPTPAQSPVDMAIRGEVLAAEVRQRDDRAGLDGLLRQKGVRVIDLLVDDLGPASLGALDEVVRTTSRVKPHHARVHVIQGVEIDRAHPGRSCVYVLVMDEHEYAKFRRKLDDRFPESASQPAAIPGDSLASLSKVGRVEFFRDTEPAGTLKRPPADLFPEVAIQSPKREGGNEVLIAPDGVPIRPADSAAARATGKSSAKKTPAVAALPAANSKDSPPLVYIVWVSPRDRPRS